MELAVHLLKDVWHDYGAVIFLLEADRIELLFFLSLLYFGVRQQHVTRAYFAESRARLLYHGLTYLTLLKIAVFVVVNLVRLHRQPFL